MSDFSRREFLKLTGATGLAAGFSGLILPTSLMAKTNGRVVIVGGGFGGATCANYIKRYGPNVDVTLVEPSKKFVTCPLSNTVIGGLKSIDSITHNYDGLKKKRGIKVIHDTVTGIDASGKKVKLKGGKSLAYDFLVVSPGVSFQWNKIAGYSEKLSKKIPHAWKAGEQTTLLRKQLESMADGGTFVITVPKKPYRAPPAPYERASLVANYFQDSKPNSKIIILDANETNDELKVFQAAWKKLYGGMIEWVPGSAGGVIQKVDAATLTATNNKGDKFKANVLNVIPPQIAGQIAKKSGLANKGGWCPINQSTFESAKMKNVFVIGDACIAGDMPKTGHSASSQAKICAASIVMLLNGEKLLDPVLSSSIYSLISPKFGVSAAGVYRIKNKKLTKVSGGTSPVKASKKVRRKEAKFTQGWYKAITSEMFAK